MIIGIDVDNTIVPSCDLWGEWMHKTHGLNMYNDNHYDNDYASEKFLCWWKDKYLYDHMEPYEDAEKYINLLAKDHKIWFLTKCFDEHMQSKIRFCNKFFKYDRFFNTGFNKADAFDDVIHYMIDDRPSILEGFSKAKCYRIKYTVEPQELDVLYSWKEIYDDIRRCDGKF